MNCHDLFHSLCDYIDDDAKKELCAELEKHMRECPDCKVQVNTLNRTVTLVRDVCCGQVKEEVVIRLKSRIVSQIEGEETSS